MPKKVLFAALVCGAFLVFVELSLVVLGVRPILVEEDPYVGFAARVPLFVESTGPDGQTHMQTATDKTKLFNVQRFALHKPRGAYRIFCLGGSTTYGRPYDDTTSFCGWLRALLPEADPSRRWEVINAGGISYASYRVALLAESLIRYQPDLFIVYSGHNEFLEKRTYRRVVDTPAVIRRLGLLLDRTRTGAVIRAAADNLTGRAGSTHTEGDVLPAEVRTILENFVGPKAYTRDDAFRRQVLDHYRFNLTRIIDIAHRGGARIMLVKPMSNLRHCSPFKSQHREGLAEPARHEWEVLYDRAEQAFATGQWERAMTAIEKAATIDDRHAHLHFLRARVLWEQERYAEAKRAFARARDEDICPLRALSSIEQIVDEVAAERGVPQVDFKALVERQSPHATPGDEWLLDHVHPTIEGNRQLALALLETMNQEGMVRQSNAWADGVLEQVRQRVEGSLDVRAHGKALRNVAMVYRWSGKFEDSYRLGKRAVQLFPADAQAHALIGANAFDLGFIDEAIRHCRQALQIQPDNAEFHNALGGALVVNGDLEEGIRHLRRALQLDPDLAIARRNLRRALARRGEKTAQ